MTVKERIAALRARMKETGIDAYLIPTDDFHGSEYVGEYFKCRKYITGFTGSAGTAVIMQDMAGLWTDGRYFIQAADQQQRIIYCNEFHDWFSFLKKKSLPFGKPFLHVSDILRFAAPRRLRKLNIHVHHILTVMTDKPLTHL